MKRKFVYIALLAMLTFVGCGKKEENIAGVNGQGGLVSATATPETTNAPGTTALPEPSSTASTAEPKTTSTPGTTAIPEATGEPKTTAAALPETTGTPKETVTPEITEESKETAKPETTSTPEETGTPETTREPEVAEPEATKVPTVMPEATKEPEEEPDEKPEQGGTTVPEEPVTPQEPEPAATEAPAVHEHSFVENETPATCTEAKSITTVCSECGFEAGTKTEGSALGHDYYESIMIPATCHSYGWAADVCKRCEDSPSGRRIETLEHDYEVTRVYEGTCINPRSTSYKCKDCGWEMTEEGDRNYEVHEGLHTDTTTILDVEAGEFGELVTYYYTGCSSCGQVLEQEEIGREPVTEDNFN